MKIKIITVIVFCCFFGVFAKTNDNEKILSDLQQTPYGSKFFTNHSKNSFLVTIEFLDNPIGKIKKIKKIQNFFQYIELFDRYSSDKLHLNESVLHIFLERHFNDIDRNKADIFHYLILISDGMYGELLADKYTHLFRKYSHVFVKSLKKTHWEKVVDHLGSGNWTEFCNEIKNLGNSKFETKLKNYVLSK